MSIDNEFMRIKLIECVMVNNSIVGHHTFISQLQNHSHHKATPERHVNVFIMMVIKAEYVVVIIMAAHVCTRPSIAVDYCIIYNVQERLNCGRWGTLTTYVFLNITGFCVKEEIKPSACQ